MLKNLDKDDLFFFWFGVKSLPQNSPLPSHFIGIFTSEKQLYF